MDSNATDVIRVGLKHVYTFQGIIVEHTDLHVILPKRKKRKNLNTAGDTCHSLHYKKKKLPQTIIRLHAYKFALSL